MIVQNRIEKRLRLAGVFVLLGTVVEVVALHWKSPPGFLTFAFLGIPIALIGIAIYLYSLVSLPSLPGENDSIANNTKNVR